MSEHTSTRNRTKRGRRGYRAQVAAAKPKKPKFNVSVGAETEPLAPVPTAPVPTAPVPTAPAAAEPAPDPVATLPNASFSKGGIPLLPADAPDSLNTPPSEPEPAQPKGPVSLAGGLAVGSGAPNVDMGKLAESRDGIPYSFEETEQDPVTVKFPVTQDQFDALSTRQQMQAEQKLNQTGVDLSKMLLPTQADVNLYQSREGRLLEGGAPEPTFEIEADPRNYVDSRRPNEGRWIDPQTGDQYNVTEAYGRLLRQRMPQLVRPEVMDRMMAMGMAPEFMKSKGDEGPDRDKSQEFRERMAKQRRVEEFPPAEGFNRDKALAEANERAAEQTRGQQRDAGQTVEREGQRDLPGKIKREEPYFGRSSDPENRPSPEEIAAAGPEYTRRQEEQEFLAAPLPDVSDTVQRELARRSAPTDADAFPLEATMPNYSGMFSAAVEDLPDAMDVSSDFNRPEAQVTAPEVDIPMDDDGEPDEGFNVEMDSDDVSSFRDAVEANFAQPRVTPELSDADLGPFIEAIFGEGTEATDEIVAQVREILSEESYRGMTPAQVRAEVRRRANASTDR